MESSKKDKKPQLFRKDISLYLTQLPEEVNFTKTTYKEVVTEKFGRDFDLQDLLSWDVLDYNRFKTADLTMEVSEFLQKSNHDKLTK